MAFSGRIERADSVFCSGFRIVYLCPRFASAAPSRRTYPAARERRSRQRPLDLNKSIGPLDIIGGLERHLAEGPRRPLADEWHPNFDICWTTRYDKQVGMLYDLKDSLKTAHFREI
jgi:hypothetical protein